MRGDCTVIRHVEIEDLGYLGEALEHAGISPDYVDAESLPDERRVVGIGSLIVLGGPMGAYEIDRHPYLSSVIDLIRAFLAAERPVLGICLGAQLLAAAAGARVYPGAHGKEIGWAPVQLTEAGANDPLWAGFPETFETFHWHGDTFDLPADAELLARTERYVQAFRLGSTAYGVQFHPEVVPAQLESWIRAYHLELERERLASEDILGVPDAEIHRALAFKFGENIARWTGECLR
ncbi:MAG: glutamine amidotransferase [Gemmatimonadetes bacterium]|nr:glutamine amidotransferase [Gemmatimonadota bacterium]NIO31990.1 glutamine amidotransferase [Gemmatimonadota bacterium]